MGKIFRQRFDRSERPARRRDGEKSTRSAVRLARREGPERLLRGTGLAPVRGEPKVPADRAVLAQGEG
jgi:hypothetical protein